MAYYQVFKGFLDIACSGHCLHSLDHWDSGRHLSREFMVRSDFLPFGHTAVGNSQEAFLDSLKVFDSAPPGTLAQGYLQMVSYKEDESR